MAGSSLNTKFYSQIVDLLNAAKNNVVRAVNRTMVFTYHEIGRMIVEEEQNGHERAGYGKNLIQELSGILTKEFGKGYSATNLKQMRAFFLSYQKRQTLSDELESTSEKSTQNQISETPSLNLNDVKQQPLSAIFNLSWSHYLILMRIENEEERTFYEIETE